MTGGANASVNQHGDYALDIGKLNALGLSASCFFPKIFKNTPPSARTSSHRVRVK